MEKISKKKKNAFHYDDEKLKDLEITIHTYKNSDIESLNLPNNKDLIPGVYEGGIKLWECALDLAKFLPKYVGWYDLSKIKVLELGCGHGLPGLYFLLRGSLVLFQDFNQEILDKITSQYILDIEANYGMNFKENCGMINGDWKDFNTKLNSGEFNAYHKEQFNDKFDMIVTADTIYNIENYDSLYNVILTNLKNPGICFVSSKKYYFGVGGGTNQFIDYVTSKNDFEIKVVKEINDGFSNIRQIIELRHK